MLINCRYKFIPDDTFYVCVSGGIDSLAVASFLSKKSLPMMLFHYNHKCIEEDDLMEHRVYEFADHLNVPLRVFRNENRLNVSKMGLEAACREKRLEAYRRLDKPLLVCHHFDDCVESYFMNFLHGTMEYDPIPPITVLSNCINMILRPFMLTPKKNFKIYLEKNNLDRFIVHDPMNDDITRLRNWSRHVALPYIKDNYKGLDKIVRKRVLSAYKKAENKLNNTK